MRIVIAEDLVLLREGIASLLADDGHEVVAAVGDGDALLAALDDHAPDLAIVDVRMPPTRPRRARAPPPWPRSSRRRRATSGPARSAPTRTRAGRLELRSSAGDVRAEVQTRR